MYFFLLPNSLWKCQFHSRNKSSQICLVVSIEVIVIPSRDDMCWQIPYYLFLLRCLVVSWIKIDNVSKYEKRTVCDNSRIMIYINYYENIPIW